jgi:glycosyltransferase involved in cell wall biosynthesis
MKILLYQGGLQSGRGIPVMLDAARTLNDVAFVFMGNGPLKTDILSAASHTPNVFHIPAVPVDEILEWSASADVGATLIENYGTSYYYSLPNKLFEYIRAGIPVIGSNFPEIGAIINQYQIGFTADPEKVDEVRVAINRLVRDEDELSRCRNNCIKASAALSWNEEFSGFQSALEKLSDNG